MKYLVIISFIGFGLLCVWDSSTEETRRKQQYVEAKAISQTYEPKVLAKTSHQTIISITGRMNTETWLENVPANVEIVSIAKNSSKGGWYTCIIVYKEIGE